MDVLISDVRATCHGERILSGPYGIGGVGTGSTRYGMKNGRYDSNMTGMRYVWGQECQYISLPYHVRLIH